MQQDAVIWRFVPLWRNYSSFLGLNGLLLEGGKPSTAPDVSGLAVAVCHFCSVSACTEKEPCVSVNFPHEIESNIHDTQIVLMRVRHLNSEIKSIKNDGNVHGISVMISDLLRNINNR